MNRSLTDRWKAGQAPFDGVTLSVSEPLPISDLSAPLTSSVTELFRCYGEENLSKIRDWHEHDGFINDSTPSSWNELQTFVASPAALATACTGETYVSLGFFPRSYSFYFRIYVVENDEPTHAATHATFDLTCKREVVDLLQISLDQKLCLSSEPAKTYFDRRDAS